MTPAVTAAARGALAPTGVLRAGLNLSNFLLVRPDSKPGDRRGVAPDIAHELGRRLGVPVALIDYKSPGEMADVATAAIWDVAFLGAEPARAKTIDFSAAYLEIESTYLVPAGSAIQSIDDVDRPGVRIAVSNRSAYELYLSRTIKQATLVRVDGVEVSFQRFVDDKMEALAGLRPRLLTDVERLSGARILPGRFTAVQQAVGTPRGRDGAGAEYLRAFVEDVKASGFVAQAIERHGSHGATVAAAVDSAGQ